jgi:hypothetical protein
VKQQLLTKSENKLQRELATVVSSVIGPIAVALDARLVSDIIEAPFERAKRELPLIDLAAWLKVSVAQGDLRKILQINSRTASYYLIVGDQVAVGPVLVGQLRKLPYLIANLRDCSGIMALILTDNERLCFLLDGQNLLSLVNEDRESMAKVESCTQLMRVEKEK